MKYTISHITDGEDELILRYNSITPEIQRILNCINNTQKKIIGYKDKITVVLDLEGILYMESVDSKTFAYTEADVFRLEHPLNWLEENIRYINFIRCSKSMIINIDKVKSLKSLASNRIDAVMCNGEHIIISRTYATAFRKRLKGRDGDE